MPGKHNVKLPHLHQWLYRRRLVRLPSIHFGSCDGSLSNAESAAPLHKCELQGDFTQKCGKSLQKTAIRCKTLLCL